MTLWGGQFPQQWPVQFLKMDLVSKELQDRSQNFSVSTAKIIRGGCTSAMLSGYTIQEDGEMLQPAGPVGYPVAVEV